MPRPEGGYKNAAGKEVPGVTSITGRFKEPGGLYYWYWSNGKNKLPFRPENVFEIGHAVHKMCELDLRGASKEEIDCVPFAMLKTADDAKQACDAYDAFCEWKRAHNVRAVAFEESLVSEELQYGGTFDIIAWVDGVRSLLDFKTCTSKKAGTVYPEQKIAMAAHANLWHEKYPDQHIQAYHLIMLPKDGGKFGHHVFASLDREWVMFLGQLALYRMEKGTIDVADATRAVTILAGNVTVFAEAVAVEPPKAEPAPSVADKPKRKYNRKPKAPAPAPIAAPPPRLNWFSTMAEMLRAFGHVKEAA